MTSEHLENLRWIRRGCWDRGFEDGWIPIEVRSGAVLSSKRSIGITSMCGSDPVPTPTRYAMLLWNSICCGTRSTLAVIRTAAVSITEAERIPILPTARR